MGCTDSCRNELSSHQFIVYCVHAITSWGDRMWGFAVGVYLIKLSPGLLRLTAIYGVVSCVTIILFAVPVGHWIDNVSRLKAARWPLIIQNTLVTLSAVFVCLALDDQWGFRSQHQVVFSFQIVIIMLASAAQLASVASHISISKDWVVVLAAGDEDKLARLNTMCRRIDLVTKICAPLLVGQIMNFASDVVSAMVIAVWNIISMAVEYTLLFNIYKRVPALANPREPCASRNRKDLKDTNESEMETLASEAMPSADVTDSKTSRFKKPLNSYISMWASYFKQEVMPAGIGLACLYMTVLAFDNITIGYAYNQGVAEWVLGLLSGAGAVIGILGTLAFPVLLRKVGLIRTGLFGFGAEAACLSICVASIWVRGSPFDPSAAYGFKSPQIFTEDNATIPNVLTSHSNITNSTQFQHDSHNQEYLSIGLLLTGILTARFGLWMADLSVSQLLQTEVEENERGVVNGVQSSINTFMDLVKFGLVVLLPGSETFGILILLSFGFICMGWFSYCVYSARKRGHILPFHNLFKKKILGNI